MEGRNKNTKEGAIVPVVEWENNAKEWLSSLPRNHKLTETEVQNWINSNFSCLPDEFKSLPLSHHFQQFNDMHSSLHSQTQVVKHVNRRENPARFQRTDLWRPVYSWLETLDLDDIISSKEICDWMAENPEVYNQLLAKHSRHHLMHYVKKCHIKMLKRKKGKDFKPNLAGHRAVERLDGQHLSLSILTNPLTNISKESNLYRVKRDEAVQKYGILVEFEKRLSAMISERKAAGSS